MYSPYLGEWILESGVLPVKQSTETRTVRHCTQFSVLEYSEYDVYSTVSYWSTVVLLKNLVLLCIHFSASASHLMSLLIFMLVCLSMHSVQVQVPSVL